jgi:Raf kinase inhibitor-like YbhB/YbcL family protein
MAFRISSPAFADGAPIPVEYTCDGANHSPDLTWTDAPRGTRSFALIVDDPDAPRGTFTHWVLYDIPAETTELGRSVREGTIGVSGRNSFSRGGYGGPCPPPGDAAHRYRFTLYALDVPTLAVSHGTREGVEAKMQGHVLGTSQLVGRYQRQTAAARR